MRYKLFLSVTAVALSLMSCNFSQKAKTADQHTSETSLDWKGSYFGVLPCASCPGIETELTLNEDNTYVLESNYLDSEEGLFIIEGEFAWNNGNIELQGVNQDERPWIYKVEENRIRQLDLEGNEITGELASHYVLTKTGNPEIEDYRWQLVELDGKEVEGDAETHFIIFDSKEHKIHAKAGCNILQFKYSIRNGLQLRTVAGLSTMMACPDDLEDELVKAITMADNISVGDNYLTLNKGRRAPFAKFKLVE